MGEGMIQRGRRGVRTATVVVAAADSPHPEQADYVCDVDNMSVVNTAIADADAGRIFCLRGTYYGMETITLHDNIKLEFEIGSKIYVPNPHNLTNYNKYGIDYGVLITNANHTNGNTNVHVIGADIDFQGDGKNTLQGWCGIWFDQCTKSTFKRCTVYDVVYDVNLSYGRSLGLAFSDCEYCNMFDCEGNHTGYEGIAIRGNCRHCTAYRCGGYNNRYHSTQTCGWVGGSPGALVLYGAPQYVTFDTCYGDGDIMLHGSVGDDAKYIRIINCDADSIDMIGSFSDGLINNNRSGDIHVDNLSTGGDIRDIEITNNITTDTDASILIKQSGDTGSIARININNNIVKNGKIEINSNSNSSNSMSDINMSHNTVGCASNWGIYIHISGGSSDITNVAIDHVNIVPTTSRCIYMKIEGGTGSIYNVNICDTLFDNCSYPIDVNRIAGSGTISNIRFFGNRVIGANQIIDIFTDNILSGVKLYDNTIVSTNYLVEHQKIADNILFERNDLTYTNIGGTKVTNLKFRNNIGFTTENSGTATLTNGTTSIAVDHGLNVTPSAGDIVVTPIEAWGNMTKFWIGNYTTTQFTIYADQNPGQDVDFAWKAIVL